jgi:hypothetical protein
MGQECSKHSITLQNFSSCDFFFPFFCGIFSKVFHNFAFFGNVMIFPKIVGILNVTPDSFSDGGCLSIPKLQFVGV